MATWEREEIADRVAASVPIRAKMGKPLGGAASFGYRWEGNGLVIDENEAPIRKLVYELFMKFKRKKTVAAELNKLGYRTRNGSAFSDTTINRLLRDSTAKGQRVANYTRSLGEGKNWVIKAKEEWVITTCDPVISEEVWNDCNTILDEQLNKRRKAGPRPVHLLSGYVSCTCGKKMYVYHEKTATYRCKPCKIGIPSADLDDIYHQQLKSYLLTDMTVSEYMAQSDTLLKEKEQLLELSKLESEKLSRRMSQMVKLRLDEEISKEAFVKEYKPLEERFTQLEKQLPDLEAEVDFLKIQYLSSDDILQEAKNLYERWPTIPFEEKRNIIEVITENIIIGKSDIDISLSYLPTPHAPHPSQNGGNKQRSRRDS
jgi:site-specific DNA recombinase